MNLFVKAFHHFVQYNMIIEATKHNKKEPELYEIIRHQVAPELHQI